MSTQPNRSLDDLRPDFRQRLTAFLAAVEEAFPMYKTGVHETLRTPERQKALYEQGRSTPGQKVTWTLDSNHLHGIAADWHLVDERGKAIWDSQTYETVYKQLRPADFGLETLGSVEQVHIQLLNANQNRETEVPPLTEPDALLLVYNEHGEEVARLEVPADGSIIDRQRGNRRYIRIEAPQD